MTFGRGFEILGLLIYTYEPNDEMENSALNSPNLRGKIPLKKKAVRYAVQTALLVTELSLGVNRTSKSTFETLAVVPGGKDIS